VEFGSAHIFTQIYAPAADQRPVYFRLRRVDAAHGYMCRTFRGLCVSACLSVQANSHRHAGHGTDWTVLSCLAGGVNWALDTDSPSVTETHRSRSVIAAKATGPIKIHVEADKPSRCTVHIGVS